MEAPGVKLAAAIVMKDPSATDRLVGFVSPDRVDSEAIIAELKQRLPAHFVPSLIVALAEMPLSPAGKVCLSLQHALSLQRLERAPCMLV